MPHLQHGLRAGGPQSLREDAQAHLSAMEEVVSSVPLTIAQNVFRCLFVCTLLLLFLGGTLFELNSRYYVSSWLSRYTYKHTYIHTYIHIYIHTYIVHTYIHTFIHTYHTIHTYIYLIHTYIHSTYIHKVYSYIQLIPTVHTYSIYIIHSKYIHTYIYLIHALTQP